MENRVRNNKKNSKMAILVGLNYTGTSCELHGCVNDANIMKDILISKYKYKNVNVLTDMNISKQYNILEILDDLIKSKSNTMYFQYSGHGTQKHDLDGDEKDGLDEALYSVCGTIITDDEIKKKVKQVSKGKTMIMIVDACHSGSIVDLPYQMDNKNNNIIKVNNDNLEGDIICITGCRDNQVSLDIKNKNTWYGAMSNNFQKIITNNDTTNLTWKELVIKLRNSLKAGKYAQVPQLCVSRKELINQKVNL